MGTNTYYEWFDALDKFLKGDDSVWEIMEEGEYEINSGNYLNFYNRVKETYTKRKEKWLEKFQKPLLSAKSENDFGYYLRDAKMNLEIIVKFINIKAFPNDLKETLKNDLDLFVSDIKKSLTNNTQKSLFKGKEALLMQINSFGIFSNQNHFIINETDINSLNQKSDFNLPKGRKIIL